MNKQRERITKSTRKMKMKSRKVKTKRRSSKAALLKQGMKRKSSPFKT